MSKNVLVWPFKHMRITQTYNGSTSHLGYSAGSPADYPLDEAGANTGKEWAYVPCDEMKIIRIYGVGNSGTNTIFLQSTSKVLFADGTSDYFCLELVHFNDADAKGLKVGQILKRGAKIVQEGTDGGVANHSHIVGSTGKFKDQKCWKMNSRGKYVLNTTGTNKKPEKMFYIDTSFTKVLNKAGLQFKTISGIQSVTTTPTTSTVPTYPTKTVKKGSKGVQVKSVQNCMNKIENAGLTVDGSFGSKTDKAVKAFQKKYKLTADGSVGPKTRAKIQTLINGVTRYVDAKAGLRVRSKASTKTGKILKVLAYNKSVKVYETKGKWSRIGLNQWVYTSYLRKKK